MFSRNNGPRDGRHDPLGCLESIARGHNGQYVITLIDKVGDGRYQFNACGPGTLLSCFAVGINRCYTIGVQ
jgi:hypothetical protein